MPTPAKSSQIWRFGKYEVTKETGELRRGGKPVKLQEQPCRILLLLLERAGSVVTREQLKSALWAADTFVDFDHSLNTAMMKLRDAIGDSQGKPVFIETVPRKGYRFIGALSESPTLEGSAAGEKASRTAELASDAGKAAQRTGITIAVLPFRDLSPHGDEEPFCQGLVEEVLDLVARTPGIEVVSRTSSARFRNAAKDIREIAEELDADGIVEGSVAKSGTRLRIRAQLSSGSTGLHLWADTFDRELKDIFAVQEEIAAAVVSALSERLGSQTHRPGDRPKVKNMEAYTSFLRGRFYWSKRPGKAGHAKEYFERAIAMDRDFGLAHAGLADIYSTLGSAEAAAISPVTAMNKATEHSQLALDLIPDSAEAHASVAYVKFVYEWNWAAAQQHFQNAIQENPRYTTALHGYSHYLMATGRPEQSLQLSIQALAVDPLDLILNAHLAWHWHMDSQFEMELEQSERTIYLDARFFWGYFFRACAYEQMNQLDLAIRDFRMALGLSDESAVVVAALGHAYAVAGDESRARQVMSRLETIAREEQRLQYEAGVIHLALGEADQCFEWMSRAFESRSGWMPYLGVDPRLRGVHGDGRFAKLLADLRLSVKGHHELKYGGTE